MGRNSRYVRDRTGNDVVQYMKEFMQKNETQEWLPLSRQTTDKNIGTEEL
ncbi:MAG: hypothetical protein ABL983_10300 [Nitrospira sp.]